jgi:hypothetical protein
MSDVQRLRSPLLYPLSYERVGASVSCPSLTRGDQWCPLMTTADHRCGLDSRGWLAAIGPAEGFTERNSSEHPRVVRG